MHQARRRPPTYSDTGTHPPLFPSSPLRPRAAQKLELDENKFRGPIPRGLHVSKCDPQ